MKTLLFVLIWSPLLTAAPSWNANEVSEWGEEAGEHYENGDMAAFKATLNKVKSGLDGAVDSTKGVTQREFSELREDLKQLGEMTGKKTRKGMREIDLFFARLHNTIARRKMGQATRAWGDRKVEETRVLMADVHAHLKQAAQKTDRKLKASTRQALAELKNVTNKIEAKGKKIGEEIKNVFSKLSSETERFQKKP